MWPAGGGFSFLFSWLEIIFLSFVGGLKMFFILDFFLVGGGFSGEMV